MFNYPLDTDDSAMNNASIWLSKHKVQEPGYCNYAHSVGFNGSQWASVFFILK